MKESLALFCQGSNVKWIIDFYYLVYRLICHIVKSWISTSLPSCLKCLSTFSIPLLYCTSQKIYNSKTTRNLFLLQIVILSQYFWYCEKKDIKLTWLNQRITSWATKRRHARNCKIHKGHIVWSTSIQKIAIFA